MPSHPQANLIQSPWATLLGISADAQVLESILNEEKAADKLLISISDGVNLQAAA